MARRGRAIFFTRPGTPLAVKEAVVPDPAPGALLVRLEMAGICGSDIHRLAGDIPFSGDPFHFGHEGVGVVEAIGAGAGQDRAGVPLRVGDRVYWFPVPLCGECTPCRTGLSITFCEKFTWPLPSDQPNAATFQDFATIGPRVLVYRIPDDTSSASVIAFGCAMPTAIGGMQRLGVVSGNVVVQGAGPLGLAATLLAARAGGRVITIGDPDNRLETARRFGAADVIPLTGTTSKERLERVKSLTRGRGADIMIEAAGHISAFTEGLDMHALFGRYLIMGLYSGKATVPLNPVAINNRNVTIIGTLGYPASALAQTIAIASELGETLDFAALIGERFPLDKTEDAIKAAACGKVIKAVVVP